MHQNRPKGINGPSSNFDPFFIIEKSTSKRECGIPKSCGFPLASRSPERHARKSLDSASAIAHDARFAFEEARTLEDSNEDPIDQLTEEALRRRRGFTAKAVRAVMKAREMALLAIASAVTKIKQTSADLGNHLAEVKELYIRLAQLEDENALLQARLESIEARHRPRYTPAQRFKIIVHKETYGLTLEETANRFLISTQTVARWTAETVKEPARKPIGSLLRAAPPLMSYPDVLRDAVQLMDQVGFGGNLRIAQTLARAGVKISKET